ncbi:MAG TPA: hypothetical protein VK596_04435, partial [Edaphobacter sp.]|nr:hypothetical protein [Edaphobacter sp.]
MRRRKAKREQEDDQKPSQMHVEGKAIKRPKRTGENRRHSTMKRPNWYSSELDSVPYGAGVRDHPVVFHGLHDGDRIAIDPS